MIIKRFLPLLLVFFSIGLSQASLALTKEEAIEKVTKDPKSLENLETGFKKDKDVVIAAVKQNKLALQYADESIRDEIKSELGL